MTRHAASNNGRSGSFPLGVLTRRMALGTMNPLDSLQRRRFTVFRTVRRADRRTAVRSASAVALGLLLLCTGCAASSSDPASAEDADSDNDPAEGVNRAIFKANLAADHAVMRPVAQAYTDHVPEVVQTGVHNVVQNLSLIHI